MVPKIIISLILTHPEVLNMEQMAADVVVITTGLAAWPRSRQPLRSR